MPRRKPRKPRKPHKDFPGLEHGSPATRRTHPIRRWSREIVRDADIDIENIPTHSAVDGPACRLADYRQWLQFRAARTLVGTAPDLAPTPRTRGECPPDRTVSGCGAYGCRYHLWRNDDPPGRPGLASIPRGAGGRTLSVRGDLSGGDKPRVSLLDARWLEHPLAPSCALDCADNGPSENMPLGNTIARHRTLAARLVQGAARSFTEAGGDPDGLRACMPEPPQGRSNLGVAIDELGYRSGELLRPEDVRLPADALAPPSLEQRREMRRARKRAMAASRT